MDSKGKVVDFEVGPDKYWEYDPENATRQKQSLFHPPKLFVTRSNAPFQNDAHQENDSVVDTWTLNGQAWETVRYRYRTARDAFVGRITNGDRLTIREVMGISRLGKPGFDTHSISRSSTVWANIVLGVKAGEDSKHTTMLIAMGIPEYSIYIPVWVALSQEELCPKVTSWDDNSISWWSFKLFEDKFDGSADYDHYIHGVLDGVETNIVDAVKAARHNWLDDGNTDRFHQEAEVLHNWSAWAAYDTVKSAYQTAGSDGRRCNTPPQISTLHASRNGLAVTFECDAEDADGNGIAEYWWNFGDGGESGKTQRLTVSHTYAQEGTYLVACYVRDGRASPAANVRFEYVTVTEQLGGDASLDGGLSDGTADLPASASDGGPAEAGPPADVATDARTMADARRDASIWAIDSGPGTDARDQGGVDALGGGCTASLRGNRRPFHALELLLLLMLCGYTRRRPPRA